MLMNNKIRKKFRNSLFPPVSFTNESSMNEQQTNIEQRLIEYYEGKLEGTAYDEVKAWIASSEENRRMARRIYSLLLAVDVHQVSKEIDTEKALKKVKGRKIAQKKSRRS